MELMMNREKSPLMALGLKEAKIRSDRFKIKILFNCFPSNKQPRDKFAFSDSATDTKHQDRRASHSASKADDEAKMDRDRYSSRQRDRELRASLGVDSHRSSPAIRQG